MRNAFVKLSVAAAMSAAMLSGASLSYAQASADDVHVDLNLSDAELLAATRVLTAQTGIQFLLEPSNDPYKKITLQLKHVTADEAIRYMCQAAGANFRKDENGVYIIGHQKEGGKGNPDVTPVAPAPKLPKHLHRFRMMHADASAVLAQLEGKGPTGWEQAFMDMNRFREMTDGSATNKLQAPPIMVLGQNGTPGYAPVNTQTYTAPHTLSESGSNIALPGESSNQLPGQDSGGGGGGFGGGGFGGGGAGGGGGGGAGRQGGGGQNGGLQTGGLIPRTIEFISFDPNTNEIVVNATDEEIRQLQDAISFFDVAPRQVTIKVEFITTSNTLNKDFGFDFTYARGPIIAGAVPGTFARSSEPIFLNFALGNITSRLRAQLLQSEGKVVNSPILRTLNNQPAIVTQGTQTTVFINQTTSIGNGNVITTSNPVPFQATTTLAVRPRINDDGTITVFLSPTIEDFGQIVQGPNGQSIPDVLRQQIGVVARVKSGDTIALAGFTRKSESHAGNRFPILGDLPIIGQFFRQNQRIVTNSELIIFVTPTIVDEDESAIP